MAALRARVFGRCEHARSRRNDHAGADPRHGLYIITPRCAHSCEAAPPFSQSPLATAKFSDLNTWTSLPSPKSGEGVWMLQFDSDHKILYSTGFNLGLVWRIVMP